MDFELFNPMRDAASVDFRGSRLGLDTLAAGDSLEMTAQPAAIKSAIVRALALRGQFDRTYRIERSANYNRNAPVHKITRVS